MSNQAQNTSNHVGDLLSGFLDGELTQQQRQVVTLHCSECEKCREDLAELRVLRERISGAPLSPLGEDKWRENMNDSGKYGAPVEVINASLSGRDTWEELAILDVKSDMEMEKVAEDLPWYKTFKFWAIVYVICFLCV